MTKHRKPFFTPARVITGSVLLSIIIGWATWLYLAGKNVAVLNPQGIIAQKQLDLMIFTLILSLIVVIPVFTLLGVISWKYRAGNTKATYDPNLEGDRRLETLWWGIPIIIIGILSVVTWVSSHDLSPTKAIESDKPPLKVQVVAMQWKWLFLYPDYDVASLNELKVPAGTPISFEITADGPMSAFWVPNLGSQTYAMEGMSSKLNLRADRPGVYRGSNSNINGEGYADMHFTVVAVENQDMFDEWARNITSDDNHDHMDPGIYEELAKPSKKNPVKYYHLHDRNLYTGIMQKYMTHGSHSTMKEMEH